MGTYVVHYLDGWLHQDTFEVQAENEEEALKKANDAMNATTIDQNFIQTIVSVEEKK